ncbi:S8 family serine peptidase [Pontibacter sp. H259]|uniref:S8 family serine peptidase n=1 Tax=Pontibacter sp. H259 TaxID=3133421 RepID=UPI0030C5F682
MAIITLYTLNKYAISFSQFYEVPVKKQWKRPALLQLWALLLLVVFLSVQATAQQQPPHKKSNAMYGRMAPGLAQSLRTAKSKTVRVQVKNKAQFLSWLAEHGYQGSIDHPIATDRILTLTNISAKTLQELSDCTIVTYIDKPNRQAKEEIELRDADFAVNHIYSVKGLYPMLNGSNMAASVKEEAFDKNDMDLKGRAIQPETFGALYTPHATTMATIIAGAGNTGPRGKGIADKARLASSNFVQLFPDNSQELLNKGVSLQNHSYGVGVENYYGLESAAYDRETFQNPTLLHVFSSGNSGNKADAVGVYTGITGFANLTGQFKTSKNTLSVGALEPNGQVGALSSKGPAYDGRVKPELVAYGIGGTSEAAAVVSGVSLLVQQAYKELHGSLPTSALVKAALINSADDAGRPEVDFEAGFGNTDALGAIRTIKDNRFILGAVANGAEKLHALTVPAGTKKLKVTLVWHEADAAPEAAKALINDLDLVLLNTTTAKTWKPWVLSSYPHLDSLKLPAKRGTDRLNNVEQITLDLPEAGNYQLKVFGTTIPQGEQSYTLAYEFETGPELMYPTVGVMLQAGQVNRIRWQGIIPAEKGRLEYKLNGSSTWELIAENIELGTLYFDWQTPDVISKAQLRLITSSATVTSGEFILAKQLNLNVGYNCDEALMLHWAGLPNVTQYQLYKVGSTHLEPYITVSDTLALLPKNQLDVLPELMSVAPIVEGTAAETSTAIAFNQLGIGCYIKSFLPYQYVSDTINMQLELSSLYQLVSVTLERAEKGNFVPLQTIAPVNQLTYKLTDESPALGANLYRVKVTTQAGNTYYSKPEELIYVDKSFVQVYPNPVRSGEMLSIVVADEQVTVQLYDQMGKLVRESEEVGMIKQLSTAGLHNGLYILRLKTESGNYVAGKILVL